MFTCPLTSPFLVVSHLSLNCSPLVSSGWYIIIIHYIKPHSQSQHGCLSKVSHVSISQKYFSTLSRSCSVPTIQSFLYRCKDPATRCQFSDQDMPSIPSLEHYFSSIETLFLLSKTLKLINLALKTCKGNCPDTPFVIMYDELTFYFRCRLEVTQQYPKYAL